METNMRSEACVTLNPMLYTKMASGKYHTRGKLNGSTYNNHLKLVKREKYKKKQKWKHFNTKRVT